MTSFNSTHYIYFNGQSLSNNRYQVSSMSWRDTSMREVATLSDETSTGTSILDVKDGAKIVSITGGVTYTDPDQEADTMEQMRRFINRVFDTRSGVLRTVQIDKTTTIFDTNATTGWTASLDATAIATNTDIILSGTKTSLEVTVDVSADVSNSARVTNSSINPTIDLTAFTGGFDVSMYFSDAYYINSVVLDIGDDSSNYYTISASGGALGQQFQNGENLISFNSADKVQTGTVTSANPNYVRLTVNYSTNAEDMTFNFGRLYAFDDSFTNNYLNCVKNSDITYMNDSLLHELSNFYELTLLCPEGFGESTFSTEEFSETVTTLQANASFDYYGSKSALPITSISFDSNVSNITDFAISSLNTGKSIAINDTSFDTGDILTFNFRNKTVQKNDIPIYFTGQTDDVFVYGKNRVQLDIGQASGQYTIDNTTQSVPTFSSNTLGAQSFTTVGAGIITSATVRLGRNQAQIPREVRFNAFLYSDSSSSPDALLATSSSSFYYPDGVSQADLTFNFSYSLSATTVYWLVMELDTVGGRVFGNFTSNYAGGVYKKFSGGVWSTSADIADAYFLLTIQNAPVHSLTWELNNKELNY